MTPAHNATCTHSDLRTQGPVIIGQILDGLNTADSAMFALPTPHSPILSCSEPTLVSSVLGRTETCRWGLSAGGQEGPQRTQALLVLRNSAQPSTLPKAMGSSKPLGDMAQPYSRQRTSSKASLWLGQGLQGQGTAREPVFCCDVSRRCAQSRALCLDEEAAEAHGAGVQCQPLQKPSWLRAQRQCDVHLGGCLAPVTHAHLSSSSQLRVLAGSYLFLFLQPREESRKGRLRAGRGLAGAEEGCFSISHVSLNLWAVGT